MIKLFTLLLSVFLIQTSFATIWLVDNNPNSPVPLTNLQTAIDNAASGDTIMVAGSPNSYGDIAIPKPLTLIGEGYNDQLGENSTVGIVYIRSSNVYFSGFNSSNGITFDAANAPGNNLINVTVERCYQLTSFSFDGGPFSNPRLMRNIRIRNTISFNGTLRVSQNNGKDWILFDSLIIENNIFHVPAFYNWGPNITGANTIIARNNLFFNGNNGGNLNTLFYYHWYGTSLHDVIFYNNIFWDCNPTKSVNCTFMNNLTYGNGSGEPTVGSPGDPAFGTGNNDTLPGPTNGNLYSQDPMFVNFAPHQAFSYNLDFHLSPGSPAIGTGVGGTDIGIYGGYYPFRVGEGPRIPIVDFINISNTAVPSGSTFYLQFDARTRQ